MPAGRSPSPGAPRRTSNSKGPCATSWSPSTAAPERSAATTSPRARQSCGRVQGPRPRGFDG
eukprot:9156213-Lingulodinium_polyedra.AAC.1